MSGIARKSAVTPADEVPAGGQDEGFEIKCLASWRVLCVRITVEEIAVCHGVSLIRCLVVQNQDPQWLQALRRRGRAASAGLALILFGFAVAQPALADPLPRVLEGSGDDALAQVLADEELAGVRGRGLEGGDLTAVGMGPIAVILWDELTETQQGKLQGPQVSHSIGMGNGQSNSLVTHQQ